MDDDEDDLTTDHYQDWTSCEWYGHDWSDRTNLTCADCGEMREEDK